MPMLLALGMLVAYSGCGEKEANKDKQTAPALEGKQQRSLVDFIKGSKLANFPSRTIGDAFESYRHLTGKDWRLEQHKTGQFTVGFLGWFDQKAIGDSDRKNGITAKGLDVQFVVERDGKWYLFMMSTIEKGSGGTMRRVPIADTATVLKKIYADEKIEL